MLACLLLHHRILRDARCASTHVVGGVNLLLVPLAHAGNLLEWVSDTGNGLTSSIGASNLEDVGLDARDAGGEEKSSETEGAAEEASLEATVSNVSNSRFLWSRGTTRHGRASKLGHRAHLRT